MFIVQIGVDQNNTICNMDKRKGLINVIVSIVFRVFLLVGSLLVRRYLIKYIGNEANGLDSLYTSIIGFLAVADLGIGSAITFCMYKPIVEGDENKVAALYGLFRKLYLIIGAIIAVAGCAIMPALPYLAKDYSSVDINVYLTFGLMLVSVVMSYIFSAKQSLLNAHKNNYIATALSSGGLVLQCILQIVVLVVTQSFVWYIVCKIVATVVQWGATEIVTYKKYKSILSNKQRVNNDTKTEVTKNVKAMFMHKIGGVLVNTADSMIISAFIGVVILGKYTNYTVIMVAMTGTLSLVFTPLTSVIGHMCAQEDRLAIKKYFNFFYSLNYILALIFFLGYYSVIDNLVTLFFGANLEMAKSISLVVTINYFIQFMRQSSMLFRDATGTFYYDRWKPIIEGCVNIGLSIGFVFLFGYLWGSEFAVVGVIVATIVTNLTICHIVEPHVLYKYVFKMPAKSYYLQNYIGIAVFIGLLFALNSSMIVSSNEWVEMFANGGISLAYSLGITAVIVLFNKDFKHHMMNMLKRVFKRKGKNPIDVNSVKEVAVNDGAGVVPCVDVLSAATAEKSVEETGADASNETTAEKSGSENGKVDG